MASHAGVAMRKSENRYDRIPTPALPGSGLRDRTALRHISASLRQRPLDCGTIVARRVKDVKWLLGNGEINSAYERTIIIEVGKREKKALTNGTVYGSLTKLSGRAERV